jgi:hypothetical protein
MSSQPSRQAGRQIPVHARQPARITNHPKLCTNFACRLRPPALAGVSLATHPRGGAMSTQAGSVGGFERLSRGGSVAVQRKRFRAMYYVTFHRSADQQVAAVDREPRCADRRIRWAGNELRSITKI